MAKTLSQIIADVRQMIAQPDNTNSNFTDTQITGWINDSYRRMCVEFRHLPAKQRDYPVTGQNVTLNSAAVSVNIAKLQNPDNLNKYVRLEIKNLDELMLMDPDWEDANADIPTIIVPQRFDSFQVILYPPPKASIIALANPLRTFGLEMPTELAATTDTPNLPDNLHDIIAHWAAYRCFQDMNDSVHASEQLQIYQGSIKQQRLAASEMSDKLNRWNWEHPIV